LRYGAKNPQFVPMESPSMNIVFSSTEKNKLLRNIDNNYFDSKIFTDEEIYSVGENS
jgi:hypothetical protein